MRTGERLQDKLFDFTAESPFLWRSFGANTVDTKHFMASISLFAVNFEPG